MINFTEFQQMRIKEYLDELSSLEERIERCEREEDEAIEQELHDKQKAVSAYIVHLNQEIARTLSAIGEITAQALREGF